MQSFHSRDNIFLTITIIYKEENNNISISIRDKNILITLNDLLNRADEVKFIKHDASDYRELFIESVNI